MGMKRYWCLKCKELKVIYSRPFNNKYNRNSKSFRCMNCDARFSYEDVDAKPHKQTGYYVNNPEKVKRLSKALFNHCAKIMNEKRKLIKQDD